MLQSEKGEGVMCAPEVTGEPGSGASCMIDLGSVLVPSWKQKIKNREVGQH